MKRRLTAALILAALIVACVSGCHFGVTAHTGPSMTRPPASRVAAGNS